MSRLRALCRLFAGIAAFSVLLPAARIEYRATDIPDTVTGENLWSYTYWVSDFSFAANQGFTIGFDRTLFASLESPPPAVNPSWNVITLQPDLNLPDDGAYDALALINNPSLADTFRVGFLFLGSGSPGSQPYTINQFNASGDWIAELDSGVTVPRRDTIIPEPSSGALLLLGLLTAGFGGMRIRRHRAR